jgi:hypothetical protein
MGAALQVLFRTLLALGLCAASFFIARFGGRQPSGAETGEFVAVGAGIVFLTAWSWRQAPPSHGAAEFTANIIRHGLSLAGAALTALLCLGTALLGAWMQHP